jgi:hypothetical protein
VNACSNPPTQRSARPRRVGYASSRKYCPSAGWRALDLQEVGELQERLFILAWLRDCGYASVSFDKLAACLKKSSTLSEKPVILCFDDDWQSQYDFALPLLKKYGSTATFHIWTAVE